MILRLTSDHHIPQPNRALSPPHHPREPRRHSTSELPPAAQYPPPYYQLQQQQQLHRMLAPHMSHPGKHIFKISLQGDPSPGEPRLGWLWFEMFFHFAHMLSQFCQFPISPGRIRQRVEHPKSKSTQPRFARRWVPLYNLWIKNAASQIFSFPIRHPFDTPKRASVGVVIVIERELFERRSEMVISGPHKARAPVAKTCSLYVQGDLQRGLSQRSLQHQAQYILLREPCDLFWDLFWGVALTGTKWARLPKTSPKTNKSHGSLKRMYCAGCCRLRWLGPLWWPCSVTLGFVEFDLVFPLSAQFCFGRWKLDRGGRTPKLKSMKSSVKPPWSPCMSNEEQSTIEQVSCTWQFSQCYCQICGWRSGWNPPEESWVPFGVSQQSILPWWSCTS